MEDFLSRKNREELTDLEIALSELETTVEKLIRENENLNKRLNELCSDMGLCENCGIELKNKTGIEKNGTFRFMCNKCQAKLFAEAIKKSS